jgi:hypothetical protein
MDLGSSHMFHKRLLYIHMKPLVYTLMGLKV